MIGYPYLLKSIQNVGYCGLVFVLIGLALAASAAEIQIAHDLQIELIPAENKLVGRDEMTIRPNGRDALEFRLSRRISTLAVSVDGKPGKFGFANDRLRIVLDPPDRSAEPQVTVEYSGVFDDPFPLRPLNTDNPGYGVSGSISEIGSFLLAGAGWYPELTGGRATYRLKVSAPEGQIAVSAGRSLGHVTGNGKTVSAWEVNYPVEGLSLSVAGYIVEETTVGKVTAATYLLPDNRHLSKPYLEATARYLELYADLFGAYPFEKFAVVENFFPTGFGFPSYTLLGSTVLRLPFIIHTSLGHEIAHCWWGNGVFVDRSEGNWSEGLTTYVADYLFKEMESREDARDYRRQWLRNFSTLVRPENDMALNQFQHRIDPASKTIGYDKSAMIFHMLRTILGEEAFWETLRDIYRDRIFRQTSWSDWQRAFEARSGRSLQNFFDQWIGRQGAPQFSLEAVRARLAGAKWMVSGRIVQEEPFFDFPLTLVLATRTQEIRNTIAVSGRATFFELACGEAPLKLTADPDDDIMRRLYPVEIPPTVNSLKSSESVLFVISNNWDPDSQQTAATLALSLGLKNYALAAEDEVNPQKLPDQDVVWVGFPRQADFIANMPAAVTISATSFTLNSSVYRDSTAAFFGVFPHPSAENRVAALFLPLSLQGADGVAAKIAHYGKYSYLAFQSGENRDKGIWPVASSPLIFETKAHSADPLLYDLNRTRAIRLSEIVAELKQNRIVLVGEHHGNETHHRAQLAVIQSLQEAGARVAIGLEMFRSDSQPALDRWTGGNLSVEEFQKIYYDNWNFPWPAYSMIFEYAREKQIPMIGLNLSRDITRQVSRQGFASLTDAQRGRLADVTCRVDEEYMNYIRKAYGAHAHGNLDFTYFCEAQLVWDNIMAINALEYTKQHSDAVVVILTGTGHAQKGAVPRQIRERADIAYAVILPQVPGTIDANTIAKEDADYILLGF
jgi:uncharacterized iron-regulated protein